MVPGNFRFLYFVWFVLVFILSGCSPLVVNKPGPFTDNVPCPTPGQPSGGFRDMKGVLLVHPSGKGAGSLPGDKMFELQDRNGMTIWFGCYVHEDVCTDGVCKMLKLWLFWDEIGEYSGLEVPCGEPLTKSDHAEFDREDYETLDAILRDSSSVLKYLGYDELAIEPDDKERTTGSFPGQVDGVTGATSPSLAEIVVKDAVYTCYTLWHTVYGKRYEAIQDILKSRADKKFLNRMLHTGIPSRQAWAIRYVSQHRELHEAFYRQMISLISTGSSEVSSLALNFFRKDMMNKKVPDLLIETLEKVDINKQSEILEKLSELEVSDRSAIFKLLKMYESGEIDITLLHGVYRLVSPARLQDPEIASVLRRLASNENLFIRNLTQKLLQSPGMN